MKFTYEEGMERLEMLLSRLEKGDMPLEESFQAYHEANEIYVKLNQMLDAGEARVLELMKNGEKKDITEEIGE